MAGDCFWSGCCCGSGTDFVVFNSLFSGNGASDNGVADPTVNYGTVSDSVVLKKNGELPGSSLLLCDSFCQNRVFFAVDGFVAILVSIYFVLKFRLGFLIGGLFDLSADGGQFIVHENLGDGL